MKMFLKMFSFFNFSGKKSSQGSTITGTASALQNPASLGKVQSVHLSMGSHPCQNSEIANSNWNNFEILFCKKVTDAGRKCIRRQGGHHGKALNYEFTLVMIQENT